MTTRITLVLVLVITLFSCTTNAQKRELTEKEAFITENIKYAEAQMQQMLAKVGEPGPQKYPRTVVDGKVELTDIKDWTPGFFPGSIWYLYELTGDTVWADQAEKWTLPLEPSKFLTSHHDVGFIMYCSFGNAQRLMPKEGYNDILVQSARSLATRYNETAKVIKSWNYFKTWDKSQELFYPVIIDNMMNLEMMLYASRISGDEKLKDIAINHANTTIKNHFREDYGSYHVVDYDTIAGKVNAQVTNQGYSDNSTWSRGQSWAIYGYTMMYRETKDSLYLDMAKKATDYFVKNLPEDFVPLWDFNAGQEGFTPAKQSKAFGFTEKLRDTSAGAIACSALFDLGTITGEKHYIEQATKMLKSLASDKYRAKLGENGNFLLMHSVGSIPHGFEVDAPIAYTDYYFLEALSRYKNLKDE